MQRPGKVEAVRAGAVHSERFVGGRERTLQDTRVALATAAELKERRHTPARAAETGGVANALPLLAGGIEELQRTIVIAHRDAVDKCEVVRGVRLVFQITVRIGELERLRIRVESFRNVAAPVRDAARGLVRSHTYERRHVLET